MSAPRNAAEFDADVAEVLAAAPHRAFGLTFISARPGEARLAFEAGAAALAPSGHVHGGVVSMLAEPAAVLALLSLLPPDRHAVTADFHAQFLRPPKPHGRVELVGRVVKAGGRLAFCEVEARSEGEVCVVARITKAIVGG